MILKDEFETWYSTQDHKGETNVFELDSDGEYMSLLTWSAYDDFKTRNTSAPEGSAMSDKPVAYKIVPINMVTTSENEREKWIKAGHEVEALYPASAYEALRKENAEHKATISNLSKAYERESNDCLKALEERDYWYDKADSLADKISEVFDVPVGEHSNVNCPFDEANKILDGEYVSKFDKQIEALKAENEELKEVNDSLHRSSQFTYECQKKEIADLKAENTKLEDELDQYKEYYEEMSEHYRALQFIESELRRENEAQAKRIAELEAATEHLGLTPQQAKDGLARHKAQVAEIEALRKQVEEHKEWHMIRDEMRKALEAQMNGDSK